MAPQRHAMLLTLRWVMPMAAVVSAVLGMTTHGRIAHIAGFSFAFMLTFIAIVQSRLSPVLVLDDEGYTIQQGGRVRVRVAWREVKTVRAEPRERALYIDCGDPARNLLVPPGRGYGFRFADPVNLYARVAASVGDRLVQVERLEALKP